MGYYTHCGPNLSKNLLSPSVLISPFSWYPLEILGGSSNPTRELPKHGSHHWTTPQVVFYNRMRLYLNRLNQRFNRIRLVNH